MPSKHELNALEIAKIKYKFQISKFDYTLPAQGVDLEFLSLRRNEVLDHLETLKVKVSTIDFTTLPGADEFHIADSMVTWYQLALREINQKEYMLGLEGKPYNREEYTEAQARYMYHATRERTI
ncbi:MAG TPA: hypothetical protein EYN54_00735 [Methylococcaceae bacterium]|nr:hypothetical protein [Methylococcaceae bacterium]